MNNNFENDDLHYVPTFFNPIRRERAMFGLSLNNTNLENDYNESLMRNDYLNLEDTDSHH
jgi:hypothetical protein